MGERKVTAREIELMYDSWECKDCKIKDEKIIELNKEIIRLRRLNI